MEDGDRAFNRLAGDIDGMLANFNACAPEDEVRRELEVQNLILGSAPAHKKPEIALQIARLLAPRGDFAGVVNQLFSYGDVPSPVGCAIRSELGHALCQIHRNQPRSAAYRQGQTHLERVVTTCRRQLPAAATDERRRTSTLARALARLAWSFDALDKDAPKARACYSSCIGPCLLRPARRAGGGETVADPGDETGTAGRWLPLGYGLAEIGGRTSGPGRRSNQRHGHHEDTGPDHRRWCGFKPEEIERMAEMEHGRWNVDRLRNGWRFGKPRDDVRKHHDCLVSWTDLSDGDEGMKKYDRQAVARFPEILA